MLPHWVPAERRAWRSMRAALALTKPGGEGAVSGFTGEETEARRDGGSSRLPHVCKCGDPRLPRAWPWCPCSVLPHSQGCGIMDGEGHSVAERAGGRVQRGEGRCLGKSKGSLRKKGQVVRDRPVPRVGDHWDVCSAWGSLRGPHCLKRLGGGEPPSPTPPFQPDPRRPGQCGGQARRSRCDVELASVPSCSTAWL